MTEEWRAVVGFEGQYEVSNLGQVRSVERMVSFKRFDHRIDKIVDGSRHFPSRELKQFPKSNGYLAVSLGRDNQKTVHILVLTAFVGPAPDDVSNALHHDDNKNNNCINNLRWGTASDNANDASRNGILLRGERIGNSKLKVSDVITIRSRAKPGQYRRIADEYGVNKTTIRRIANGTIWKDIT